MRFASLGRLAAMTLALTTLSPEPARADAFYCGNRLVKRGDSDHGVRAKCGEPQSRAPVVETQCLSPGWCQTVQVGERWTYDFGPQTLIRHVLFRNQKVESVETGEYGQER